MSLPPLQFVGAAVPFRAATHHLESHKASSIFAVSPFSGTARRESTARMSLSGSRRERAEEGRKEMQEGVGRQAWAWRASGSYVMGCSR